MHQFILLTLVPFHSNPILILIKNDIQLISIKRYDKAKSDLTKALTTLNNFLENKKFLVNDKITLAGITIASALVYPFKVVCDETYRKSFPNVIRWFTECTRQNEFKAVIGTVSSLRKKKLLAPSQKQ